MIRVASPRAVYTRGIRLSGGRRGGLTLRSPSVPLTDVIGGLNPCRSELDRVATWGRYWPPYTGPHLAPSPAYHPAFPAARRLIRPTLSFPQRCSHPIDPRLMLPISPLTQGTGITAAARRCSHPIDPR